MYVLTLRVEMGRVIATISERTPNECLYSLYRRYAGGAKYDFLYAECRNENNDLVWRLDNHTD
jgi:hypothetical protein